MKTYPSTSLGLALFAMLAALPCAQAAQEEKAAACSATQCSDTACTALQTLEKQALAEPSKAGELLTEFIARQPEQLEEATILLVGSFAKKLPANELQAALRSVMQTATSVISSRTPAAPVSTDLGEEARQQALLEQDLRVATAVQSLTRRAVQAVKDNLTTPSQTNIAALGIKAEDGEIIIDPQDYAFLMKNSMEQVVLGSLDGLGQRSARIPEAYLPSTKSIQQDAGSYAYSMLETAPMDRIPSALAAPVEDKPAADKK